MIKLIETLEEILEMFDFVEDNIVEFEELPIKNRLAIANTISELAREVDYMGKSEHLLCKEGYSIARTSGLLSTNPLCTSFSIDKMKCYLTFVDDEETVGCGKFTNPYRLIFGSTMDFVELCTLECFELLYTKAREGYAQQIYDVLTKPQRLRVLHYTQFGVDIEPFEICVNNLLEAHNVMDTLANYDYYQYDNQIKPDYRNYQCLEIWNDLNKLWCDWVDIEFWTNDVSVLIDRYEEYKLVNKVKI